MSGQARNPGSMEGPSGGQRASSTSQPPRGYGSTNQRSSTTRPLSALEADTKPPRLWNAVRTTMRAANALRTSSYSGSQASGSRSTGGKGSTGADIIVNHESRFRLDEDGLSPTLEFDNVLDDLGKERELRIREEEQQRLGLLRQRAKNAALAAAAAAASSSAGRQTETSSEQGSSLTASTSASSVNLPQKSLQNGSQSSIPVSPNRGSSASTPGRKMTRSVSSSAGVNNSVGRHAQGKWQNIAHLLVDPPEESDIHSDSWQEQADAEVQNAKSWHHFTTSAAQNGAAVEHRTRTTNGNVQAHGERGRGPTRRVTSAIFKRFFSPTRRSGHPSNDGSHSSAVPSVVAEPISMIDDDAPSAIPEREDPLAYIAAPELLLDEADIEEEIMQREDQRKKVAVQKENLARTRAGGELGGKVLLGFEGVRSWSRKKVLGLLGVKQTDDDTIFLQTRILTNLQRGILKCVLAYALASLCTFAPYLSSHLSMLLPNHDPDKKVPIANLHMIATVAVYFHPAKTKGAMLEADAYAIIGWVYAIALCATSMISAVYLHDHDLESLSNVILVVLFLGVGMGLVAWSKVKMGSPTFNTACSMIGIIMFTVTVKEGAAHLGRFSLDKIWQVTICVVAGTLITNFVCFAIWPQSAATNLQVDIRRNLTGFSTLLKALTKTFLLDDPSQFYIDSERIKRAIDDHHASFTSLKKNLREARMEGPFDSRMRGGAAEKYVRVTDSMNRLAQHLAGLRSSCGLQHRIMTKQRSAAEADDESGMNGKAEREAESDPFSDAAAAERQTTERWEARANAFGDFVQFIGPHMRSLVFTCSRTLRNLRSAFLTAGDVALPEIGHDLHDTSFVSAGSGGAHAHFVPGSSFELLSDDLRLALERFQHEQTVSIKRIYESTIYNETRPLDKLEEFASHLDGLDVDEIMPEEQIFLVFFFVFNLEEFAKELQYLTAALEEVRQGEERIARKAAMGWFEWFKVSGKDFLASLSLSKRIGRRRRGGRVKRRVEPVTFPDFKAHQVNTAQTPQAQTIKMRFSQLIWSTGRFLRRSDVKFAIKTGVGCALLAAPGFNHSTRPTFKDFQGQWALVSYMVVMSPTVGQSNQMSLQRILGTIVGAAAAYAAYTVFPDNNVALPIFGALFSIPCFWMIAGKPQHASAGRFVLLTYNLTALYSYNLRKVGVEVEQIAIKRMISVIVGVVWATVLTHLIWPMEARRQLAEGMSDLLFKLSWLYQRLVLSYSNEPPDGPGTDPSSEEGSIYEADVSGDEESRPLLVTDDGSRLRDQFQPLELQLQVTIIKLEGLLVQTKHEPRLKGPFPIDKYRQMINCCQSILDKLHSMRCVTGRDAWHRLVRRDFVIPVNAYRRELVGNVLLFFYILGSAFVLKTPIPPYLPPAGKSRQNLLDKIRALPVVRRRQVRGGTEYLLFYSYALAMSEVIEELERIGHIAQANFGVLGGSVEAFERQFTASAGSAAPTPYARSALATPRLSTVQPI